MVEPEFAAALPVDAAAQEDQPLSSISLLSRAVLCFLTRQLEETLGTACGWAGAAGRAEETAGGGKMMRDQRYGGADGEAN